MRHAGRDTGHPGLGLKDGLQLETEVISGVNAVREAFRACRRSFHEVFALQGNVEFWGRILVGHDVKVVEPRELDRIAGTTEHQGIAARVSRYRYARLEDMDGFGCIVMLDSVEDPRNLGSAIRSSYALARAAVVIPEHRSARITPAVVRSSAGAVEHASVARVTNLRAAARTLRQRGRWLVGLEADAKDDIRSVPSYERIAIVVGGEDRGLRPVMRSELDLLVRIPMEASFNSLNLSQALGIALYELVVRRNTP